MRCFATAWYSWFKFVSLAMFPDMQTIYWKDEGGRSLSLLLFWHIIMILVNIYVLLIMILVNIICCFDYCYMSCLYLIQKNGALWMLNIYEWCLIMDVFFIRYLSYIESLTELNALIRLKWPNLITCVVL